MATILLTGVTGAVGSSLAPLLKERGHKLVCLIRGDKPVARLEKILGGKIWFESKENEGTTFFVTVPIKT